MERCRWTEALLQATVRRRRWHGTTTRNMGCQTDTTHASAESFLQLSLNDIKAGDTEAAAGQRP